MSTNRVGYEWTIEVVRTYDDGINDIDDLDFWDTYAEVKRAASAKQVEPDCRLDIGLVRHRYDEYGDLIDTEWAYMVDGKLPETFEDARGRPGSRVPARFHAEVAA